MKKFFSSLILLVLPVIMLAQGYNSTMNSLSNFLTRMYDYAPFEGVKIIDDYEHRYLLSVVVLDISKYKEVTIMNRVASVKAISQANRYFNGSYTISNLIVRMSEKSGATDTEIINTIRENSAGFIKELELLTAFDDTCGKRVYMFIKQTE